MSANERLRDAGRGLKRPIDLGLVAAMYDATIGERNAICEWLYLTPVIDANQAHKLMTAIAAGQHLDPLTPAQPPEPTEFGAMVRVKGVEYVRTAEDGHSPWSPNDPYSFNLRWSQLTAIGSVEVLR